MPLFFNTELKATFVAFHHLWGTMEKKNRILVLIDGFNYYHKLSEYQEKYNKCVKWLNYKNLVTSWLNENDDKENMQIYYFSAIATWRGANSVKRHKTYIKALENEGIIAILGEFKKKKIKRCSCDELCKNCNCVPDKKRLIRHEEKNSDVNLAITLLEKTIKQEYDKCFILSADNDFASAITKSRELNENVKIIIQPPPLSRKKPAQKREYAIDNLEHCSGNKALLTNFYTILKYQFPDNYAGLINPFKCEVD